MWTTTEARRWRSETGRQIRKRAKEENRGHTLATAPLLALYHTRPGRGRMAPMLATLMMEPPRPCSIMDGTTAGTLR